MIIDCCLFSGELLHLEMRLKELEDIVDLFVVVEGSLTFQGDQRSLSLPSILDSTRFIPWKDKIRPVYVDDIPGAGRSRGGAHTKWFMIREAHQRNAMERGFRDIAGPGDLILMSDADEIPSVNAVNRADHKLRLAAADMVVFDQAMYVWHRGWRWPGPSWNTCAMLGGNATKPQTVREQRIDMINAGHIVSNGGWHLTWMGGLEACQRKLTTFSHAEHLDKLLLFDRFAQEGVDINGVQMQAVNIDDEPWPKWFADYPGCWTP